MKKILIGLAVLGVLFFFFFKKQKSSRFETQAIERVSSYTVYASGIGTIQPISEYYLSVKNGGKLEKVFAQPGAQVKASQVIGIVDETMRRSELEQALSNYRFARTELNRNQNLFRMRSATDQAVDESRTLLSVRRAELEKAKQALEDSVLRSPIDGVLSFVAFNQGESVPDGSRVAVVEDRSGQKLTVKLPFQVAKQLPKTSKIELSKYDTGARKPVGSFLTTDAKISIANATSDYDAGSLDVEFVLAPDQEHRFATGDIVFLRVGVKTATNVAVLDTGLVVSVSKDNKRQNAVIAVESTTKKVFSVPVEVLEYDKGKVVVTGIPSNLNVVAPVKGSEFKDLIKIAKDYEQPERKG